MLPSWNISAIEKYLSSFAMFFYLWIRLEKKEYFAYFHDFQALHNLQHIFLRTADQIYPSHIRVYSFHFEFSLEFCWKTDFATWLVCYYFRLWLCWTSKRHINHNNSPWYENLNFTFPSKDILCIPSHERAMASLKNLNSSRFVVVIIEGMNLVLFKISSHFIVNDCREKDRKHSKTRSNPLWKQMKPCWN